MKKILLWMLLVVIIICISIITAMKLYMPTGSVLLKTQGRAGNQLFQYAAAYSLAKETDSKLYVIVNRKHKDLGYKKSEYALGEFNIPEDNIVYLNKYNRLYFNLMYNYYNNKVTKFIKKILKVNYVHEINYFKNTSIKNDKIIVVGDYFESPIYFEKYNADLFKQFTPKKISLNKLDKIINKLDKKNSVCIHVRRGDMLLNSRYTSIDYQKQSIALTQKLIKDPKFFIFSDDQKMVMNELSNIKDLEFINGTSPIEDLYLMSKCGNNIITRSSFSWWAAYLNSNNGLVIAPYNLYSEVFYKDIKDQNERYTKRASYARATPNNWILLNDNSEDFSKIASEYVKDKEKLKEILEGYVSREFDIYSGNRIQIEICKNGDFQPKLCFLNSKFINHKPTILTSYYDAKNKHILDLYSEWIKKFFKIPFDLVVFTDRSNLSFIKKLRVNIPTILIEKNIDKFEQSKFLEKYQYFSDLYQERNNAVDTKNIPAETYITWNEKISLVSDIAKINPYNSNFFIWLDNGVFRDVNYLQNNFLNDKYMIQDKITIFAISDFTKKDLKNSFIDDNTFGLQGGVLIGNKRAWTIYSYLYILTKNELINQAYLDKSIISTMAIKYPKIFNIVYQDPRNNLNRWWYELK